MDILIPFWNNKAEIGLLETAARAAVMFTILLTIIRIAGMRPFGKETPLDILLTILLGSVAARGIIGATPFFSSVAGCIVLVGIHRLLARITFFSQQVGKQVKGEPKLLYKNGSFIQEHMKHTNITENDIMEELRASLHMNSLSGISEIYFERTGQISFIQKDK
jgi:uncharacterized membrane protein YcaP (DUF421 family)